MINKNNNKKLISFSPRSLDMIEAIMAHTGHSTVTSVVTRGIEELYKNTFKYGTDPLSGGTPVGIGDEAIETQAERIAKKKTAIKSAEETERMRPKVLMCQRLLKGELYTDDNNNKFCRFTQYRVGGDDQECTIPLGQVDPIIADTSLFMPSKKSVLNKRPELKALFNEE